jgi:hypothetical protein
MALANKVKLYFAILMGMRSWQFKSGFRKGCELQTPIRSRGKGLQGIIPGLCLSYAWKGRHPSTAPPSSHLLDNAPSFVPAQVQYPVWYFFYGTLADVPKLSSLLSLPEGSTPVLHPATVAGGRMETWGAGKYNALVDGPEMSFVKGSA